MPRVELATDNVELLAYGVEGGGIEGGGAALGLTRTWAGRSHNRSAPVAIRGSGMWPGEAGVWFVNPPP